MIECVLPIVHLSKVADGVSHLDKKLVSSFIEIFLFCTL